MQQNGKRIFSADLSLKLLSFCSYLNLEFSLTLLLFLFLVLITTFYLYNLFFCVVV